MTPEEAKPTEMVDEQGNLTLWFTSKETAEIAKAYAEAYYYEDVSFDSKPAAAWREKFEGWSK